MRLTVIPGDSFMSKDGIGLFFGFVAPGIHAIQWDGSQGHVERYGLPNELITNETDLAGYVAAYDTEVARIAAMAAAELAIFNSSEEVTKRKLAEVNAIREAKIAAGIPFMFPDGPGTIQTRDLIDVRNIQTNIVTALILQAAGETGDVMVFRDMENALHKMSPKKMVEMGLYVAQYGQVIYSASWTLKDAAATLSAEEINNFDVAANWPK